MKLKTMKKDENKTTGQAVKDFCNGKDSFHAEPAPLIDDLRLEAKLAHNVLTTLLLVVGAKILKYGYACQAN